MSVSSPSLQYAEKPTLRKRRVFRRWMRLGLLILLACGVSYFGPSFWIQARLWYWTVQCREYTAPPSEWVCEELPSWGGNTPPFHSAAPTPEPLAQMERLAGVASVNPPGPVLYLHERTTPGGVRRLVVVRRIPSMLRQSWDAPLGLEIALWRPRRFLYADVAMTSSQAPDPFPRTFEADQSTPSLRLFAGQTDPADPSRFTIGFETVGGLGLLEGKLKDSGVPTEEPRVEWTVK